MSSYLIKNVNCTHVHGLPLLSPGSVDVVVTSPPYNIGTAYNSYNDKALKSFYLDSMRLAFSAIARALSPQGSFFLNVGNTPKNQSKAFEVLHEALVYFKLQNTIHWIKSIALEDSSFGHFKPINSPRFLNDCHEYIFHLTLSGNVPIDRKAVGVPYKDPSNAKRWASGAEGFRCRGNTWFIPYETVQEKKEHPAAFPKLLPEMCIKLHGLDKTKTVCDPFMGIGTTAIACLGLGVESFIGYEIDAAYCNVAQNTIDSILGNDPHGVVA